ncbi:MAG: septal ring lytic transglycosylase RlpA family protein [Candidatus Sulfotelmatobacter sp.]
MGNHKRRRRALLDRTAEGGRPHTIRFVRVVMILILLLSLVFLAACGHPKQAHVNVPPPPPPSSTTTTAPAATAQPETAPPAGSEAPAPAKAEEAADLAEPTLPPDAKPISTETGLASWYGPPYHNRRGSNGEVYNMHAMTAAHRTFPLGSIVRVTNVKSGQTALVRITDRGPFIPGRVIDLSLAAARKLDVWQAGVAPVKVELMQSGAPLDAAGKWAVQIGGFTDEKAATKLADHLTRRYRTAKVLRFPSPAGDWWIRVRVLDDDHERAQKLAAETTTSEGAVFVVRLD